MKLFLQKMQNFRALGAKPPNPRASGGWGLRPKLPEQPPHCEFLATRLVQNTGSFVEHNEAWFVRKY